MEVRPFTCTIALAGLSVIFAAELYHEQVKFDKQFKYAEKKGIPYIVILGSEELANGTCKLKNLLSGEQQVLTHEQLLESDFQ